MKMVQNHELRRLKCNKVYLFFLLLLAVGYMFLTLSCNENNDLNLLDDRYLFTVENDELNIFHVYEDSISRYNFKDSIYLKNIAHFSKLINRGQPDEVYDLFLDNNLKYSLRKLDIKTSKKIPLNPQDYWYYNNGHVEFWTKFFQNKNKIIRYDKELDDSIFDDPQIYLMEYKNYFDKFNMLQVFDPLQPRFIITKRSKDSLVLFDYFNNGIPLVFTKVFSDGNCLSGKWRLKRAGDYKNANIFTNFELFDDNSGILRDGFYKNDSLNYFIGPKRKKAYFMVDNENLNVGFIRFNFTNNCPDVIFTKDNPDKLELKYSRR